MIAFSQVAFGLLSDAVPARDLLAAGGAVVIVYAVGWWVSTRSLRSPDLVPPS